jgi:hypothetical protein
MKLIKFLSIAVMLTTLRTLAAPPITQYSIRSQSFNTARHVVGTLNDIHKFDQEKVYGLLTITPEYNRSFNPNNIAHCLFGSAIANKCDAITISGSDVANRGANDWLADYFYLPPDFQSTVKFKPVIDQFLVDLNWYLGLDEWVDGLYFALYTPLTHTRWDLHLHETIGDYGVGQYAAGYFGPAVTTPPISTFSQYASGTQPAAIRQTVAGTNETIALEALNFARMSCTHRVATRFADVRAELGWDMLQEDDWHFGLKIQVAAPCGTRPNGDYLFEPIVGNGRHWEFGAGVTAHVDFWQSEDRDMRATFYFDALAMHMFGARQRRTFDLTNRPFSRYMLAMEFTNTVTGNLQGGGVPATSQFDNVIAPVANLTNMGVSVSIPVQADILAMFNLSVHGWSWDLGYEFWARSCEDIKLHCNFGNRLQNQSWALKGDAQVFGFIPSDAGSVMPDNSPIALSATESKATINAGVNGTNTVNGNVDNAQLATGDINNVPLKNNVNILTVTPNTQINTSIQPIFLSMADVNPCNTGSSAMTSKVFTHVHYSWLHRTGWVPSLGIGGQAEFAHNSSNGDDCCETTNNNCDDCPRCAASNWALWLKFGIAFE